MIILNLDPTYFLNYGVVKKRNFGKKLINANYLDVYDCSLSSYDLDELKYEIFQFSGGESHIKLINNNIFPDDDGFLIIHRLNSAQNIMELLLAADALRRKYGNDIKIKTLIPYIPYGRQDRVMVEGEPFSIKVFADIIKTANFEKILTFDPHSDVTSALIDNLVVLEQNYLKLAAKDIRKDFGEFVLVAPDGGALKKIYNQAKMINYNGPILCGGKVRDVSNGKIIRITLDTMENDIKGLTAFIIDDIASRAGTFMALSKVLKENGAKHVCLAVSHYEGVADENALKESGIERVYTTNSMKDIKSDFIIQYPF